MLPVLADPLEAALQRHGRTLRACLYAQMCSYSHRVQHPQVLHFLRGGPEEFAVEAASTRAAVADERRAHAAARARQAYADQRRDRWRKRANYERRRGELWKPFAKRLVIKGMRITTGTSDAAVDDPMDMRSATQSRWAPIFADETVGHAAMCAYLDTVFAARPAIDIDAPTEDELVAAAKAATDSAPGPDGLPSTKHGFRLQRASPCSLT